MYLKENIAFHFTYSISRVDTKDQRDCGEREVKVFNIITKTQRCEWALNGQDAT